MFFVGWKLTAKIRLACPAEDDGSTPSITAIGKLTATSLFTKIGFCVFLMFSVNYRVVSPHPDKV